MSEKQEQNERGRPDDTWATDELVQYVREERSAFAGLERKCVKARYRIGCALLILKPRLKAERRYRKWLAEEDISTTLEWEATKLAERVECEEDLVAPSITETLVKYGIVKRCRRAEDDDQNDADSEEQDADDEQQADSSDQSSTLPPGTVAQKLRKPKAGSTKKTARKAKGTASKSTKSKPTARRHLIAEVESQAFPPPAPDCIPTDAESEAALGYVRAIGDLKRAFQVLLVIIDRLDKSQT